MGRRGRHPPIGRVRGSPNKKKESVGRGAKSLKEQGGRKRETPEGPTPSGNLLCEKEFTPEVSGRAKKPRRRLAGYALCGSRGMGGNGGGAKD